MPIRSELPSDSPSLNALAQRSRFPIEATAGIEEIERIVIIDAIDTIDTINTIGTIDEIEVI